MSDVNWAEVHNPDQSWRTQLIGNLSHQYVMPRYAELFTRYFQSSKPLTFLELGAGTGEMAVLIQSKNLPFVKSYAVTENFPEGVSWLKKKGLHAFEANAESIPVSDASYDAVLCFDVMHHVSNPRKMAHEMLRTARGRLFLTESNGLSLGRKLMELTPGHRKAGEKSYTPRKYRSFFEGQGFRITRWEIHPFIFPLKLPREMGSLEISFNRWIEKTPFLNWQCSNVYIYLEYEALTNGSCPLT